MNPYTESEHPKKGKYMEFMKLSFPLSICHPE